MRAKIPQLQEAFAGFFTDHHALLLQQMLNRIDGIDADINLLDEIPGIGATAAAVIIAEIGVDMSRFPTAGHLCSWARFAPGIKSSAGKTKDRGSTGHGNRYRARILGEAAVTAERTETFLGERYRRMRVIIWQLLADPAHGPAPAGMRHRMGGEGAP
jgi:transposase